MCDAILRNLSDLLSDCQKCLCHYCRCLFGSYYCCCEEYELVTYEKSNPNSKARVLIPDACEAVGANYCDLNAVLRGMGVVI